MKKVDIPARTINLSVVGTLMYAGIVNLGIVLMWIGFFILLLNGTLMDTDSNILFGLIIMTFATELGLLIFPGSYTIMCLNGKQRGLAFCLIYGILFFLMIQGYRYNIRSMDAALETLDLLRYANVDFLVDILNGVFKLQNYIHMLAFLILLISDMILLVALVKEPLLKFIKGSVTSIASECKNITEEYKNLDVHTNTNENNNDNEKP